jgi:hypothetical protein
MCIVIVLEAAEMLNMTRCIIFVIVDIDECMLYSPCLHAERCIDMYGTYICECKLGWTGKNCDKGNLCFH